MAKKAVKQTDKIPLGLKLFVGLCVFGMIGSLWDLKAFMEVGGLFGFTIGTPFAVVVNLIGLVLGGVVPIMSVFNRKILFWKISLWFLIYSIVSILIAGGIVLFGVAEYATKFWMTVFMVIGLVLSGLVTWYYYSKKSYFNK